MALPGSVGEDKYKSAPDAKHLLDEIGEVVYKQVKKEADGTNYINELKGSLASATTNWELGGTDKPCMFDYTTRLGANSERHPCTNLKGNTNEERFSDTLGGQCTKEKISGSTNTCGACAPFRRLHLCHHNLEKISTKKIDNTHKLLAEVCYAAKEEGASITRYHGKHKLDNNNSASQLCTVLARSFADIGDIVRGRDLFYGNPQESAQRIILEKNFKKYFQQIYNDVTSRKKSAEAKDRYKDTKNFYQLREDWWTANRETVWKAITCNAQGNTYFRATCDINNEKGPSMTPSHCRCEGANANQVPTYFDYVPQFLRWFEEWAEDFCRLRKRKLEDAKNKCRRVENGEHKYCDLNRHNCARTIRGDHVFVEEDNCKDCHFSCSHFVKWIDNQKLEFDKQREKYKSEISGGGGGRKKRGAGKSNYDGYEKKFYGKLKETNYNDVDKFLEKLNDEDICTKNTDIEDGGTINFKEVNSDSTSGDGSNKTFDHTTYCQACPWCGVKEQNGKGGKWEPEGDEKCAKKEEKSYKPENITDIPVLTPDKEKSNILDKYKTFCSTGDSQIKKWQCYYKKNENNDGKKDINFCVLQDDKVGTSEEKSMHYNSFFWDWVYHMLHDSLDWRERLNSCINNAKSGQCENKCNSKCECFAKWAQQKEKEWKNIVEHFKKQKDIDQKGFLAVLMKHEIVLEQVLDKDLLLKSIKDTHADAKDIEHIRKMLNVEETSGASSVSGIGGANGQNSIIDKLLQHEGEEAGECLETHKEKCPEDTARGPGVARSDSASPDQQPPPAEKDDSSHSSDDDDDDDDEESEEEKKEAPAATEGDGSATTQPPATTTPKDEVKVCETVGDALKLDNLKEACKQKYDGKYYGWKCVPTTSGGESDAKDRKRREADSGNPTSDTGSICVPPRRRRLYVTPLTKWAADEATKSLSPQGSPSATASSQAPNGDSLLLTAFVESAAVETFFLWDRYKKIKDKEKKEKEERENGLDANTSTVDEKPQEELQSGKIPNDFLRLMFYTLGDYRDILYSGDTVNGGKENKIKTAIDNHFQKIREQSSSDNNLSPPRGGPQTQHSDEQRKSWWNNNGQHIWKGMVCALTYTDSGTKDQPPTQDKGLKEKLLDKLKKENGKVTGEEEGKYHYEKVTLENSETEARTNEDTNNQPTKLSDFVLRPTYFRYLEEWGETFCRERKKRLKQIKVDCEVDEEGNRGCSGDGLKCKEKVPDNKEIFGDFLCSKCAKP
ncbi:hypothetical protein PFFVO_03687, partial [Plasmodium falciparum Vietnam Oak-Knoll (FVO)]